MLVDTCRYFLVLFAYCILNSQFFFAQIYFTLLHIIYIHTCVRSKFTLYVPMQFVSITIFWQIRIENPKMCIEVRQVFLKIWYFSLIMKCFSLNQYCLIIFLHDAWAKCLVFSCVRVKKLCSTLKLGLIMLVLGIFSLISLVKKPTNWLFSSIFQLETNNCFYFSL